MRRMPIGVDLFRVLREKDYYFVDKTGFIKQLIDWHAQVTLITRPRRFGKTLTLSMLKEFFDIKNQDAAIFAGLSIAEAGEKYLQHQGKYPVVFISMKMAAAGGWQESYALVSLLVSRLYNEYGYLSDSTQLEEEEKAYYRRIKNGGEACSYVDLVSSLKSLTKMLYKHHGVRPIVLIDEYDAPIQYAWEKGFYDEMIGLMRAMYGEALKTNEALNFAVLTGVLRVAKESIFGGLNNLQVCTVLSEEYNDVFGFTSQEVADMARELGQEDKLPELKEWYDGYNFGGAEIYNPWSVIQYFQAKCRPSPYWVNTSANGIVQTMMQGMDRQTERRLQQLMAGGSVFAAINESIIYTDIGRNTDDLYSLLLNTGYLKAVNNLDEGYEAENELKIPNKEIHSLFQVEIFRNMNGYRGISDVRDMLRSMLAGDLDGFDMNLEQIVRNNASYHDAANGESFYHGLMLGFCVLLKDTHTVKSNQESGYGRFDIALIPKDKKQYGVTKLLQKI